MSIAKLQQSWRCNVSNIFRLSKHALHQNAPVRFSREEIWGTNFGTNFGDRLPIFGDRLPIFGDRLLITQATTQRHNFILTRQCVDLHDDASIYASIYTTMHQFMRRFMRRHDDASILGDRLPIDFQFSSISCEGDKGVRIKLFYGFHSWLMSNHFVIIDDWLPG